ncbi:DUF4238 domain-containing protein [Sneathiella sp. HT1-7]|uniref:DUF4238 domain-containing protein n=1 Tax=Sneathiella sp. HT1-7 TaxID=2887192 RepID=UPI001D140E56|nr:DUF4238 domain-containing protein [Sneathiella sp. HT1-7]MCC3305669.1 DUF4238 domain-containing protein [Sneathiella sp. HT1-7]
MLYENMRHHYVPQFLLRAWANGSLDGKVEDIRLDLNGFPSSRRAPKSTGYKDDLYALSKPVVAGMKRHDIEKIFLMQVDNLAARAHQKLVEHGLRSLTNSERSDWVRFLMSLRVRQPDIVQKLKIESEEQLTKTLAQQPEEYDVISENGDPPTLVEWTEQQSPGHIENFGLLFFHEIASNPEVGDKIFKMKWWLWDFTNVSFDLLLGDHPCVFTKGIDDPNLIIALPISPKKAFMATNSEGVAATIRKQVPKQLAMRLNESSLNQARARIYARNTSPKRFIQNRAHFRSEVKIC